MRRKLQVACYALLCHGIFADFYRDLGVSRRASASEIKAAYRDAAKKYHPDKNKDVDAHIRFQKIAAAYETLSDPEKRRLYDLHGSDYAQVQQQHEQRQQQQRQQEEFFNAFGSGHRRSRHNQGPPIFSSTLWLTSESYRDLVEDSNENWLLQFYHDGSEQCKEFAPRWEALAGKLPPMVRLARVNIDQNFGLVQRYRSFVRCRQNAFLMECTTPAIVLVTPGGTDGNLQARWRPRPACCCATLAAVAPCSLPLAHRPCDLRAAHACASAHTSPPHLLSPVRCVRRRRPSAGATRPQQSRCTTGSNARCRSATARHPRLRPRRTSSRASCARRGRALSA